MEYDIRRPVRDYPIVRFHNSLSDCGRV